MGGGGDQPLKKNFFSFWDNSNKVKNKLGNFPLVEGKGGGVPTFEKKFLFISG